MMNVQKAEMKMQLAQTWAKRFQDMEESAQKDVLRMEGGIEALKQAAKALDQHRGYYQKAVDDGDLDMAGCKFAMSIIDRCVGGLQNLADRAQMTVTMKQGEVRGLSRTLDVLEKDYHAERTKIEAVAEIIEKGEYDGRPQALSATQDIQARRDAAKARKAQAAPVEAPETPQDEPKAATPPLKVVETIPEQPEPSVAPQEAIPGPSAAPRPEAETQAAPPEPVKAAPKKRKPVAQQPRKKKAKKKAAKGKKAAKAAIRTIPPTETPVQAGPKAKVEVPRNPHEAVSMPRNRGKKAMG